MRLRVRHKLVLLSLAILIGVASAFVLLSAVLTRRWVEEELRARATLFARALAATISTRDELRSGVSLEQQVRQIQEVRDDVLQLDVVALEPESRIVVATTSAYNPLPFSARDAEQVRRGRVVSRLVDPDDAHRWEVIAPIALDGTVVGALAAGFSSLPAARLASRLWLGAAALTGAGVVVAGVLAGLVVRVVVDRPVQRFMAAIARLEAGDTTATVDLGTGDEFGVLARHFNATVARLQRFNDELQTRVTDATAELDRRYREVERLHVMLFDLQRLLSRAERLALSGRLMAEVAHEVGTPLHSVAGHLELLRKDLPAELVGGEIGRRVEVVETQVMRVIEIIARLLDLTRPASGTTEPVDLNRLVGDICELVRPTVAAAGLTLEAVLGAALPRAQGHAQELQQVILNLLTNAIDATPAGGRIRVSTRHVPPGVEITVADTGRGIAAEHRRRIFEPFFTTKSSGRGTGLGLAIASQIVRAHGGRIEVASEVGQGSTFRVSVQAVDAA
jgi:signal transduction histidine kinase